MLTSQEARLVAHALAGNALHQDDWYVNPPDGGPPIKAVRSRIPTLEREHGYGFHHRRRPDGTTEYRLAQLPDQRLEVPGPAPQPPNHELLPLFDLADELDRASARPGFWDLDGES